MKRRQITFYFSANPYMVCDYMLRLAQEFAKKSLVFGFLLYERPYFFWRDIWNDKEKIWERKNGIHMIRQVHIFPFGHRIHLIKILNKYTHVLVIFPLVVWWIKWKKRVQIVDKPIFIFYHPEKEENYFRIVFNIFAATHRTFFDVVDYPPVHRVTGSLVIYKEYMQKADIVIVNSKILYEKFSKIRKDIHVVPLGFALKDFSKQPNQNHRKNSRLIIGFFGSMGSRINYNLLEELIKRNPKWLFLLWGPLEIVNGEDGGVIKKRVSALFHYGNVIHGESQRKESFISIFQNVIIYIIPYITNRLQSRYSFPQKIFEYFYLGKPVVSTPIEELKQFPQYVKIGNTVREWEAHIKELIAKPWPQSYQREQRQLAIQNSWKRKHSAINKLI